MITCLPDWVSELSSRELHELTIKTRAHLADQNLLREYEKNADAELKEFTCEMRKRRASALKTILDFPSA
jgi:hypothetical protein